jgi:hypothetical protein
MLHFLVLSQVKNVERIELGKYEMETWYFSPLPPEYSGCKVRGPQHILCCTCWPSRCNTMLSVLLCGAADIFACLLSCRSCTSRSMT